MRDSIDDTRARRTADPEGLRKAMSWSFGIHLGAILLAVLVPSHWFVTAKPDPILMTISLGGSPGERSGGMAAAGARPVERAVPEPPRSTPVPPATPPKTTPAAVAAAKPTPKPTPTAGPPTTAPDRPPTTGKEVTKGTAAADTGSKTQGTGLTFGGGQGGAEITLDSKFCCPAYVEELLRRIGEKWKLRNQPVSGATVVRFEIRRDGSFSEPVVVSTTNPMLAIASRAAFAGLVLPPLPREYGEERLVINLTFPYKEL